MLAPTLLNVIQPSFPVIKSNFCILVVSWMMSTTHSTTHSVRNRKTQMHAKPFKPSSLKTSIKPEPTSTTFMKSAITLSTPPNSNSK